jgi:Tfp pilus assembly protein PilF
MRRLALLICLVALAAVALSREPPQGPDARLTAAKAAIRQNDAPQAAELLEKAIALRPNSPELHYRLGSAYAIIAQRSNLFRQPLMACKAKAEFERAVQLDPNISMLA